MSEENGCRVNMDYWAGENYSILLHHNTYCRKPKQHNVGVLTTSCSLDSWCNKLQMFRHVGRRDWKPQFWTSQNYNKGSVISSGTFWNFHYKSGILCFFSFKSCRRFLVANHGPLGSKGRRARRARFSHTRLQMNHHRLLALKLVLCGMRDTHNSIPCERSTAHIKVHQCWTPRRAKMQMCKCFIRPSALLGWKWTRGEYLHMCNWQRDTYTMPSTGYKQRGNWPERVDDLAE